MGNAHAKPHPRPRNKKQVHWKAADRPSIPGKPRLSDNELTPDLVTIIWTKPVRDGGSPISGYLVEHRRTGSTHWVRSSPALAPLPELTLSGLEPGWRYQFRVRAENAVGLSDSSEESEPLTVTLQKFAITAPKFTEELKDATVLENEKVEFVGHFMGQPVPKICWFKDGFEIFSSRRTRILTDNDKSILTIHQSALADEGEIKCTATNKAGHTSTKAKLSIEAPPSIRLPRQYEDGLLFEIGEVLKLKVSVAGRPTPLVFWSHNGETIKNDDRYEIEHIDKSSILKLGEARRTDRGEYNIKAVNKVGEDIASFLVTITDKPSPPGRARVIMTLGKSVTLSWSTPADDGGCKIGNYIVEYYRLGWNVWLKAATSRQLTTILGDLIEGSEYKFRVKAESPYGVSEPSEESDVVFIPDPKRGITSPQARSQSQPKDIIDDIVIPKAVARKSKGQARSQSSTSKAESMTVYNSDSAPIRPERTKIKSPPKTPELSPRNAKKAVSTIIDRASIARELAYGSPEIKHKLDIPQNNSETMSQKSANSKSPSPQSRTPSPKDSKSSSPLLLEKQQSDLREIYDVKNQKILLREKSEEESSEFMLVLYPNANEKGHRRALEFDFEDYDIPPPLSLSAPELGAEPPIFESIRTSASSTELLYERAMVRFNKAVAAEEEEERKKKSKSESQKTEIPKIQINSKDNQDIVGLERKPSRRRSSGGIAQQQLLWAQKKFYFSKLNDLEEIPAKQVSKIVRQRSESEEKEEEEFEKIRVKMALNNQSSLEKRSIEIADEDKWLEDYEESLSESETESSEDERDFNLVPSEGKYVEEEEDTYHPGPIETIKKPVSEEPFEILTKRNKPPDPSFIPKPILKRNDEKVPAPLHVEVPQETVTKFSSNKPRSQSPMPPGIVGRMRSMSLAQATILPQINEKQFNRSTSLTAKQENVRSEPKPSALLGFGQNISAVATLCGITAASIVIPDRLIEKQQDQEEAKVVVDHYMDIVKNYGQRKKSISQLSEPLIKQNETLSSRRLSIKEDSRLLTPSPTKAEILQVLETSKIQDKTTHTLKTSTEQSGLSAKQPLNIEDIKSDVAFSSKSEPKKALMVEDKAATLPLKIQNKTASITENKSTTLPSAGNKNIPTPRDTMIDKDSSQYSRRLSVNEDKELTSQPLLLHSEDYQKSNSSKQNVQKFLKEDKSFSRGRALNNNSLRRDSKTLSISPSRPENWSLRKSSPSPLKKRKSSSPSPIPYAKPKPKLREIMTQTSIGLELNYSSDSRASSPSDRKHELMVKAEENVRSLVDYITDLAMFFVACWLYLFSNELLAIPVLSIMVYRQLQAEVKKRIPKWIIRRFRKSKAKKR